MGGSRIPGIYCLHPNTHVAALKQAPWTHLLAFLGQSGQRIMVDLLVDCSIFVSLEAGLGNYYQLSGRLSSTCLNIARLTCGRIPLVRDGSFRLRTQFFPQSPNYDAETVGYRALAKAYILR